MLSKNQMTNLYAEIAPSFLNFLEREREKIEAEVRRLQKREGKHEEVVSAENTPQETHTV